MSDNPSNNHNSNENDALLDQHIDALRNSSTDAGPSPETVSATLRMLQTSRINSQQTQGNRFAIGRRGFYQRLVAMTLAKRIAAAVLTTIGAGILYFTLFSSMGGSVAFAQVVEKIAAAHTLTCNVTTTLPGRSPVTMKLSLADPDRMRTEMPGMVSIVANHVTLLLDTNRHTAIRTEITGTAAAKPPGNNLTNLVETFRAMSNVKGESIGDKTIDGVEVTGFRATVAGRTMTVWADKKTADLVRVEMPVAMGGNTDAGALMVFDHFSIDPPLDDSLFATDLVPDGYTLTKKSFDIPANGELADDVAKLLGDYAENADGAFPASLDDWAGFSRADHVGAKKHPEKKYHFPARIMSISGRMVSQPVGTSGYAGKGAKLGENNKIIFWYEPDPTAKPGTYRAVFGDLHIAEVTKDRLPATQPTTLP